jgi:hypothetical protein
MAFHETEVGGEELEGGDGDNENRRWSPALLIAVPCQILLASSGGPGVR